MGVILAFIGIFAVFLLCFGVYIRNGAKKLEAQDCAIAKSVNSNPIFTYDEKTKTMNLLRKSEYYRRFVDYEAITFEAHYKEEEKLMYTSVTVGGVKTGGFDTYGGGMVTKTESTGHYHFYCLKKNDKLETISRNEVEWIELTPELADDYEKSNLSKKYFDREKRTIRIVHNPNDKGRQPGAASYRAAAQLGRGDILRILAHESDVAHYPTYDELYEIENWIRGKSE